MGIEGFDFTAPCIYLRLMLLPYINFLCSSSECDASCQATQVLEQKNPTSLRDFTVKSSSGKLMLLSFVVSRLYFGELLVSVELKRSKIASIFIDNGLFSWADKPQ